MKNKFLDFCMIHQKTLIFSLIALFLLFIFLIGEWSATAISFIYVYILFETEKRWKTLDIQQKDEILRKRNY